MVLSFAYGDWVEICRNVPSMPACSLFLKQFIAKIDSSQFPSALALPNRATDPAGFDVAIGAAGLGVRSVCAIPRMGSLDGYPGSAGNTANIVCCAVAVILGLVLAFFSGKRQAAVARLEMQTFFIIFALQSLFQLLATGSFIAQNSKGIVWVTAIQLGLVLLLFWTLAWCTFLQIQLIEDGTLASLIPWTVISVLLFIGFTYICLDTAFSVSGYFDTTPATLHNNWIFTILIVLCGAFILFTIVTNVWVSGMFLRERRPLALSALALFFFALSQGAFWGLSQVICINTSSKIDGSFLSTICIMISLIFYYWSWKTVTEDTWDEVATQSMTEYDHLSARPASSRYSQSQIGSGQYVQSVSPIPSNYPYQAR